jgi:magnesium transporter
VRVLAYGPDDHAEETSAPLERVPELRARWPVLWVDVDGLGDGATIQQLGQQFGLHPLALEDVVHTHQRAKVDQYGDHCYIAARMLSRQNPGTSEQLSLFVGRGFVLTFQEQGGDCLDPVRARIRGGSQRIRRSGADYLAYAILDAMLDEYFPVLEGYGERVERLEERVLVSPDRAVVAEIRSSTTCSRSGAPSGRCARRSTS